MYVIFATQNCSITFNINKDHISDLKAFYTRTKAIINNKSFYFFTMNFAYQNEVIFESQKTLLDLQCFDLDLGNYYHASNKTWFGLC